MHCDAHHKTHCKYGTWETTCTYNVATSHGYSITLFLGAKSEGILKGYSGVRLGGCLLLSLHDNRWISQLSEIHLLMKTKWDDWQSFKNTISRPWVGLFLWYYKFQGWEWTSKSVDFSNTGSGFGFSMLFNIFCLTWRYHIVCQRKSIPVWLFLPFSECDKISNT